MPLDVPDLAAEQLKGIAVSASRPLSVVPCMDSAQAMLSAVMRALPRRRDSPARLPASKVIICGLVIRNEITPKSDFLR
jgi:hypothetical protein